MSATLAAEIPRLLMRYPAPAVASATGRSVRTVFNWFNGRTKPSFEDGVRAMSAFPELVSEVAKVAGHRVVTEAQFDAARRALKVLGEE